MNDFVLSSETREEKSNTDSLWADITHLEDIEYDLETHTKLLSSHPKYSHSNMCTPTAFEAATVFEKHVCMCVHV